MNLRKYEFSENQLKITDQHPRKIKNPTQL